MDVRVAVGDIAAWKDEVVVVNLFEGITKPGGATGAVDKAMGGAVSHLIASGDVKGKFKETFVLPTFGKIPAARIFVIGLEKLSQGCSFPLFFPRANPMDRDGYSAHPRAIPLGNSIHSFAHLK